MAGPYINVEYTTAEGDGCFKDTPLFFYKLMILTAYYPFTGVEGTTQAPAALSKPTPDLAAKRLKTNSKSTSCGTLRLVSQLPGQK